MKRIIYYGLQPLLIFAVLAYWLSDPTNPVVYPAILVSVQVLLGVLEYRYPARADWLQPAQEKLTLIIVAVTIYAFSVFVVVLYDEVWREPLNTLRSQLGLVWWPQHWPMLAQIFMAIMLSELIWYGLHRAEHQFSWLWRASGHGAHHAFHRLGAINFGANHPVEMFVILIPSLLVELLFGAGLAAAGAAVLAGTQASIAHSNLSLNTRGIGWIFTTNRYHIHHHSQVLEESNSNYGCSIIFWDHIFRTFRDADTVATGTGPTEPTLWQKFLMPVREPADTQIAPYP